MKKSILFAIIVMALFGVATSGFAANKNKTSQKTSSPSKNEPKAKSTFQREHVFDQAYVQGQYQVADEGLAVVEDEKNLDDLLGMRFEFKDRLRKQLR